MRKNEKLDFKNDNELNNLLIIGKKLVLTLINNIVLVDKKTEDLARLYCKFKERLIPEEFSALQYIWKNPYVSVKALSKRYGVGLKRADFLITFCYLDPKFLNENFYYYDIPKNILYYYKFNYERNYFLKYTYKNAPDFIVESPYICVFCNSILHFRDFICDNCDPVDSDFSSVLISINIGMGVLDYLYNCDNLEELKNHLSLDSNTMREDIVLQPLYQRIYDCLPIKINETDYNNYKFKYSLKYELIVSYYLRTFAVNERSSYLKRISVDKLFGFHSYEITLKDDLSVIFGTNALGKTTIFKLLEAILCPPSNEDELRSKFSYIKNIPFDRFSVCFLNDEIVELRKSNYGFSIKVGLNKYLEFSFENDADSSYFGMYFKALGQKIPILNTKKAFRFVKVDRNIDVDVLKEKIINLLENNFDRKSIDHIFAESKKPFFVDSLNNDFLILCKEIETKKGLCLSYDKIAIECLNYENDSDLLNKMYLDDYPNIKGRLIEFVKDLNIFKKVFESLYFCKDPSQKKLYFEQNTFCLKTRKSIDDLKYGNVITFNDLSSGEKNIATILFELLFNVKNRSILLIDEPEISLHPMWQRRFCDICDEIIKYKKHMQIIIASHSPFITSGKEDVVVLPVLKRK